MPPNGWHFKCFQRGRKMKGIPCIKEKDGIKTLFVNDEPFFILGGETHNSSASDLNYMKNTVWPAVVDLNLNTLLVPIYWEKVEPREGIYDFKLLDGLIEQARNRKVHLVLLWFGLWKNAESDYVPRWVKKDTEKYFRIEKANGEKLNIISPLCSIAVEKDARAFKEVMRHIKAVDGAEHTVLMMQVENEIGILGTDRDYGKFATTLFQEEVPSVIKALFNKTGSWKACFEDDAEEYFMAYHYAMAIEKIAESGRSGYLIPCYTNCWLEQFPWKKGSYPSGGPVPRVHALWKKVAPSLFCLAPDIYVPYVTQTMAAYCAADNPLFIPEVRQDAATAAYCLYAIGKYHAIGYSPFAIEEYGLDPSKIKKIPVELMMQLNIDPTAFNIEGAKECVAKVYKVLQDIKPLYYRYRGTSRLKAFIKKEAMDFGELLKFEEVNVLITHGPRVEGRTISGGIIIELSKNNFYIIGMRGKIEFLPKVCDGTKVDYMCVEEGSFEKGIWQAKRCLNGDERNILQLDDLPTALHVEVYTYK